MEMGSVPAAGQPAGGGLASIRYNAFNQPGNHVNKTVGQVRSELGGIWGIPNDASVYVNDKKVDEAYQIGEGDQVVFHRKSGDKGE